MGDENIKGLKVRAKIYENLNEYKNNIRYDNIRRKFEGIVNDYENWIENNRLSSEPCVVIKCNSKEIYEMYSKAAIEYGLDTFEPIQDKYSIYHTLYIR